jgi:hypothetical protein
MKQDLIINGFCNSSIAYCEAMGLSNCFKEYASIGEDIMEGGIGFNQYSGYVYIALENGITICSSMGGAVEFLVTNPEDGEETFFDYYREAEQFITNF